MNNENNSTPVEPTQEKEGETQIKLRTVSELKAEVMKEMTETYAKTITKQVMQNIQRHFLVDDTYKPPKKEVKEEKPLTDEEAIQKQVEQAMQELKSRK